MPPHSELHHWHTKHKTVRVSAPSNALVTYATIGVFLASFLGTLNLNPEPALAYVPDISLTQLFTYTERSLHSFQSGTLASLSPVSQLAAAGATDIMGTITDWFGSFFIKNEIIAMNEVVNIPPPPVIATPTAFTHEANDAPIQQTIINQQSVIERTIVQEQSGLSQSSLTLQLTTLKDELLSRIANINLLAPSLPAATFQAFATAQRIDQLSGTSLTNVTVSGVSGLTDADIPDSLTASNYLELAGGVLTGALTGTSLTLSGLLTAGSLAVSAISSSGAVEAPYFTATSTTASSTFPNFNATNATTTNATSTSLFSTLGRFTNGIFDTLLTAASATITNLTATTLTATTLTATNATTTRLDALEYLKVGGTATTTIRGDGVASILPYASSTAVTVSGTAYFPSGIWNSSGYLGVGTTTPNASLTVWNSTYTMLNIGHDNETGISLLDWSTGNQFFDYRGDLRFRDGIDGVGNNSPLTLTSSGFVGVGTTSPWAQLSINPTSSNGAAPSFVIGSSTATKFIVTNAGNVGIGTTNPIGKLEVAGGTGTSKIYKEISTGQPDYTYYYLKLFKLPTGSGWSATTFNGKVCATRSNDLAVTQCADIHVSRNYDSTIYFSENINAVGSMGFGAFQLVTVADGGFNWVSLFYDAHTNAGIASWSVDGTLYNGNAADVVSFTEIHSTSVLHSALSYTAKNTSVPYGNVGIGMTAPTYKFQLNGQPAANGYTAWTNYSDARLKENVVSFAEEADTLTNLMRLRPVTYNYNELSGYDEQTRARRISGFIAQEMQTVFPSMVGTTTINGTEYLDTNLSDLSLHLLKAIQDIASLSTTFKNTLIAWLADAGNGIATIFAKRIVGDELCAKKSDGTLFCVSGDQLADAVSGLSTVLDSESASSGDTNTTTPPTITISGENPATIQIGDIYNDLGAIAKDSEGHDLSYRTFINGVLAGDIVIDTSAEATNTIDFVATDTWGNTATSTRTVIVEVIVPTVAADADISTSSATSSLLVQ